MGSFQLIEYSSRDGKGYRRIKGKETLEEKYEEFLIMMLNDIIPPLNFIESYDRLNSIERKINQYHEGRIHNLEEYRKYQMEIWEVVKRENLHRDIDFTHKMMNANFDKFLEVLYGYLNEIKHTTIKAGPGVLLKQLDEEDLINMILHLVRLPIGDIPGLYDTIAEMRGYNYHQLVRNRGRFCPTEGKTYGQILDKINYLGKELITVFANEKFDKGKGYLICKAFFGREIHRIIKVMDYIADQLVPYLRKAYLDGYKMLNDLEKGVVSPKTFEECLRRNTKSWSFHEGFNGSGPSMILTKNGWEVGKRLGETLLNTFLQEEDRYPNAIAIILLGMSSFCRQGEDIAQVLYLLGVKPVWDSNTGQIYGLEVIPLEALGRPRIDVIMEISPCFRESFPEAMGLLDLAVEMVAALDETEEENYIRKHLGQDIHSFLEKGETFDLARTYSLYRIFGCRTVADEMAIGRVMETGQWTRCKELGDNYLEWSGYAYSRNKKGVHARKLLHRRLKQVDIVVQNTSCRERDILDRERFYQHHGGIGNAVKSISGKAPKMYCGDSSNPFYVRIRSIEKQLKFIFRCRVLNPHWIESIKKYEYQGALYFSKIIDYVFCWDALTNCIDDWMYEELAHHYIQDEKMWEWLRKYESQGLFPIVKKLLEAVKRKMWCPEPKTLQVLMEIGSGQINRKEACKNDVE
ncbi:cobaltochelatase CobN [Anaerosolibacter carboniphilus]|uniref:Cobaltochelatase CobN n=1 Tax=Anaerosolibacter carboniphilus TaxID=1417629 RepID=A0A841KST9_9FIRM|nr:cobaltochelatase subunit CobN [Anaerosolibacter carboniphilus]MBB6216794.1 cobaltochelatase CobN [Anaerosolibacter carboniphilus]